MAKLILKEEFQLRPNDTRYVKYHTSKSNDETPVTHYYEYFACTCNDDDKKYWKDEIAKEFSEHNSEEHADIFSQLVMDLNWSYDGYVSNIVADQWFGLSVKLEENVDGTYEPIVIYMQCDELTIGLFAVIQILKNIIYLG